MRCKTYLVVICKLLASARKNCLMWVLLCHCQTTPFGFRLISYWQRKTWHPSPNFRYSTRWRTAVTIPIIPNNTASNIESQHRRSLHSAYMPKLTPHIFRRRTQSAHGLCMGSSKLFTRSGFVLQNLLHHHLLSGFQCSICKVALTAHMTEITTMSRLARAAPPPHHDYFL